jgi:hypothetical protein
MVNLHVLKDSMTVCRLDPGRDVAVPAGAAASAIWSLTITPSEVSVVCPIDLAPADAQIESGWTALVIEGPLDFGLTGILASIAGPLAEAGISIFALSTYDTDYVLVKSDRCEDALRTLQASGHVITR